MMRIRAAAVLTMVFAMGLAVGTQTPKSPEGLLMKSAVFLWEATPRGPPTKAPSEASSAPRRSHSTSSSTTSRRSTRTSRRTRRISTSTRK